MINEAQGDNPIPFGGPPLNGGGDIMPMEAEPIGVDCPWPLPEPQVPVITSHKVITQEVIQDWGHLDVMAYGLLKAMDYGYRSYKAIADAERIKDLKSDPNTGWWRSTVLVPDGLRPVAITPGCWRKPRYSPYKFSMTEPQKAARIQQYVARSKKYDRLAADHLMTAMPVFAKYMANGNFGTVLYSVLQRVDRRKCERALGLTMKNIFPAKQPTLVAWDEIL